MINKRSIINIALGLIVLTGCGNNQNEDSDNGNQNNGTLEADVFTLEFKEAEIIQSPMETSQGVFLTFDITNTSDGNIVPNDMFYSYVAISQTTDTSIEFSTMPYHTLDAFGEDADSYNKMVEESRQLHNELLPGATVEARFAYDLNYEDLPVTIIVYNTETNEEEASYEFELN